MKAAAARLLPASRRCFDDNLRQNRVQAAGACLQAWQTLSPTAAGLPSARLRLAQRWLAIGSERLGNGDLAFAAHAAEQARLLQPTWPNCRVRRPPASRRWTGGQAKNTRCTVARAASSEKCWATLARPASDNSPQLWILVQADHRIGESDSVIGHQHVLAGCRCMPSTAQVVPTTGWPWAMLRLILPFTPAPNRSGAMAMRAPSM